MAPLFFWEGVVSRAGQVPIDEHSRGRLERAMPAMVGWVRLLVVGRKSGRWSVRGGVPTLERGNDPPQILLMLPRRGVGGWPRREGGAGHGGFPGKKTALWR